MIADLQPYPEYKESGSEWLGAVPVTWGVQNLRTLISKRTERDRVDLPLLSVAREKGVFVRSHADAGENHNVIPDDLSNYKVARAGNLVINKMKAWQGSMGIAPCDGIVSPAYFVFDFRIANHAFGQRLLRSKPYVAHFGQASDGVRVGQWDLSIPGMRQIPVLVPPPDEQATIVRFLDWANGRLERAIRAKRKVIALLNEQKQAIIHRAVTRGLDPSVPLKPSGIPWLGDIPAHWEVRRLGSLLRERGEGNDLGEITHVLSLLRGRGVIPYDEKGNIGNKKSDDITRYKIVRSDDIVMNCMNVIIGSVGISRHTGCLSPVYYVLVRRNAADSPHYLNAIFQCSSFHRSLVRIGNGILAHRMRIPMELLKCELLPYPPCEEQAQIVQGLHSATEAFSKTISRLEREIDLLREYRTRLVADVVTGKLDVREAAARLPEDSAVEPSDDDAELDDEPETEEAAA